MSKNKTVRNVFFTILCLFACISLSYAESCSTVGDVQYKYTAEGCGYSTVKRTCCSNGSWSSWGTSCTYCAGNASYDYGWFRGVCYKTDPLSCSDVTLSDRTWSGGYANEDDGWWLACGCPDGASVTINQRMYTDNKMDVTMACYDHPQEAAVWGKLLLRLQARLFLPARATTLPLAPICSAVRCLLYTHVRPALIPATRLMTRKDITTIVIQILPTI